MTTTLLCFRDEHVADGGGYVLRVLYGGRALPGGEGVALFVARGPHRDT